MSEVALVDMYFVAFFNGFGFLSQISSINIFFDTSFVDWQGSLNVTLNQNIENNPN